MSLPTTRSKQLFIETPYRPRDRVKWGPVEAYVNHIRVGTMGLTYELLYWVDQEQRLATVYGWELSLLEEAPE